MLQQKVNWFRERVATELERKTEAETTATLCCVLVPDGDDDNDQWQLWRVSVLDVRQERARSLSLREQNTIERHCERGKCEASVGESVF